MLNDPERAAAYLLALHDEREALGPLPRTSIPAAILVVIGGAWLVSGAVGLIHGGFTVAMPWIVLGAGFLTPGIFLGRRSMEWLRRVRSLRRGIELIEKRRLTREDSERIASSVRPDALNDPTDGAENHDP